MRGSEFDRLSHGMCSRHETQHMPRLRLAPLRAHARFRVAVAELGVVDMAVDLSTDKMTLVRVFASHLPRAKRSGCEAVDQSG